MKKTSILSICAAALAMGAVLSLTSCKQNNNAAPDKSNLINIKPYEGDKGEGNTAQAPAQNQTTNTQQAPVTNGGTVVLGGQKQADGGSATTNAPATVAKANSNQTNPALMENMQGTWKSVSEKGVTYKISGDQISRFVNDKQESTGDVYFGNDCGLSCGNIDKQHAKMGHAGCITIHTKTETCFWVINTTKQQLDFIRLGVPNAPTESWIRF